MVKLDRTKIEETENDELVENEIKPSETQKRKWKWFRKKQEPEELTFATKHQKQKKRNMKKIMVWSLIGLIGGSTLIGLGIPLIQNMNLSRPTSIKQPEKQLDSDLMKAKEKEKDNMNTSFLERERMQENMQQMIDDETKKISDEYNQKLETATKQVQSANEKASKLETENAQLRDEKSKLTEEKSQLAKELETLKQNTTQNSNSNTGTNSNLTIPEKANTDAPNQ